MRNRLIPLVAFVGVIAASCNASTSRSGERPASSTTLGGSSAAVKTLLKQGISQAESKMATQAVTTFDNVLELNPGNVYALYNLGVIDQEQKNTTGALSFYDRALRSNPKYTPAMYNEAIIEEATDLPAALALYQKIVAANPKASTAYLRMAFVYSEQGKAADASIARLKAISLDPSLSKYPLPPKK